MIKEYLAVAEGTRVFLPKEIEVLKEVLEDYENNPATTYRIFKELDISGVAGFVIFGKNSMTDFSWDVYWLVVSREKKSKGIGKKLMKMAEDCALKEDKRVILRVETSGRIEYKGARDFYNSIGYKEAGRIPDFYFPGDDLVVLYREIRAGKDFSALSKNI